MRFRFIHQHRLRWPVGVLCRVLRVARSGYYAWRSRPESRQAQRRRRLTKMIRIVHAESRQTYGSPRVWRELLALGWRCSVNFVARLMRAAGIAAKSRRKYRATTDSRHALPVAPNRVWLTDISYIPTREGWLYLCAVEDLYSRRIVGCSMGPRIDSRLVVDAVQMAIARRRPAAGLVLHSDRGSQYCSDPVGRLLARHGLVPSMSRKGDPYDNAPMESFYRTLKVELVWWEDYLTRDQARTSLVDYIERFYNGRRRHSSLDYQSPVEFEDAA